MKIKSSKQSFFPKIIIGSLLLIGLIVLCSIDFSVKDITKNLPLNQSLPDSVSTFLEKPASLEEVLAYFKNEEIFLGIKDDAATKFPKAIREKMAMWGGEKLSKIGFRDAYAGYFKNGKFVEEKHSKDTPVELKKGNYTLKSAGNKHGNFCELTIKNNTYQSHKRGLNVFVKSKYGQQIFQYAFDFFAEENPKSTGSFGITKHPELEQIELVLGDKAFKKIVKKRREALDLKLLMTEDDDLVNAKVLYKGKYHRVETRLKGDWTDHLAGDKWSFRVKMKDEETIMGMRKFSLHHPRTRNYVGEWLFHQLLEQENVLHLQYKFVQFWLNNKENAIFKRKNLGIYAIEESFDKLLFERQKRRAGVIIKLDESIFWEQRAEVMEGGLEISDLSHIDFTGFEKFNIIPFSEKTVMRDPNLRKQFGVARDLLQSYILGERKATEVFDVEKLVSYNTVCNLLGSYHAMVPHNWRLYYNPITSRLEPIGFDANGLEKAYQLNIYEWAANDLDYLRAYNKRVQELVETRAFEKLNNFPGLQEQIEYLSREYNSFKWDEKLFHHNFMIMRRTVLPKESLNVYLEEFDDKTMIFSIENYGKMPIELKDIRHQDNRIFGTTIEDEIVMPGEKKLVTYQLNNDFKKLFINKKKKKSAFVLHEDIKKARLAWNTIGTTIVRQSAILPWRKEDAALKASFFERRAPKEMPDRPFLEVDEANKIIRFKSGKWNIRRACQLPAGYEVHINSGCHIRFNDGYGQIISYSPVRFIGTKDNPVIFESDTGQGGGIFVTSSPDTSIVQHCIFNNLGIPKVHGWSLSGAVNFFENPVKISNSTFKNNRSEDGLNVMSTYFEMNNVGFSNTQSDAFDGDFVEGIISNCTFKDLGNDAIDVSGSDLMVKKVIIMNAGDKALSAGEKSKMTAEDVIIQNSEVAVASKDLSQIFATQLALRDNKLGFTAFQKKPEFGACQIEATNIQMENNELDYLIERNSSLNLNGQMMPVSDGVKERMYGAEFGKSSK